MDLDFFSALSLVLIFLASVCMLLKTLRRSSSDESCHAQPLPPGPPKLPLIGNLHQLFRSRLIHRGLLELATRYGPIMHLQLGEVSTVVISSVDIAKEALKTHDAIFANHPNYTISKLLFYDSKDITFAPYGEYWRQLRKICAMELLSRRRVESFRSLREEEVSSLAVSISHSAGSVINLSQKVFSLTTSIITRAAFGKRTKDEERLESLVQQIMQMGSGFILADLFPSSTLLPLISGTKSKIQKLFMISDGLLDDIIANHKKQKPPEHEDLVDVLLRCELSMEEIKAVILDVFLAGSETSSTVLEWAMSELLKNPRIMEKAQAEVRQIYKKIGTVNETSIDELVFLKAIIKETLRVHPPGPLLIPRESTDRCQIYGYEIPTRTRVIINAWAIARDPTFWVDGKSFNPERFIGCSIDFKGNNLEFIPFGTGKRICPGMYFGLANIELPLAMLLYHFDWNLPDGQSHETFDMAEKFGAVVRRKHELHLIPISHPCSSIW